MRDIQVIGCRLSDIFTGEQRMLDWDQTQDQLEQIERAARIKSAPVAKVYDWHRREWVAA
jgi:hypothetical protein